MAKWATVTQSITAADARLMAEYCDAHLLGDDSEGARFIRRLIYALDADLNPPVQDMFAGLDHDFSVPEPGQIRLF